MAKGKGQLHQGCQRSFSVAVLLLSIHSFFFQRLWESPLLQSYHWSNSRLAPLDGETQSTTSVYLVAYRQVWLVSRRHKDKTNIINEQLSGWQVAYSKHSSHCFLYVQWLLLLNFCCFFFSRFLWEKLLPPLSRLTSTCRDQNNCKLQVVLKIKLCGFFSN